MYSSFAKEFDQSRFSVWNCVQTFLSSIEKPDEKKLLDAGCGNGKNMVYANKLGFQTIGFDVCPELVSICKSKTLNVYQNDILSEIKEKYDVIICIAVIHHLKSVEERNKVLTNLYNALNPGGKLLVTAWSFELFDYEGKVFEKAGDNIVGWNKKAERYYYIYNEKDWKKQMKDCELEDKCNISWEKQNWISVIEKPDDNKNLFGTSNRIETFWKANPQYWISIKNQTEADKVISEMFYDYDYMKENALGQIIYLDQFSRHFQRFKHLDPDINHKRLEACLIVSIIIDDLYDDLYDHCEEDVYFCLMVYKHLEMYDELFHFLNKYLKHLNKPLNEFPILHKFFMDSYKKAYTFEKIYSDIRSIHFGLKYDPLLICDSYPEKYVKKDEWLEHLDICDLDLDCLFDSIGSSLKKLSELCKKKRLMISLSGGVDSMTMLALCKLFNIDCIAVHIVYGNRSESMQEYGFLIEYCKRLEIPLYVYCIEHLKRGEVDREFYESITRNIRFFVYNAVGGEDCYVCLGHIKDDVVENIWSNLAKGVHLDDLKMMKPIEYQHGVYICRPFLNLTKEEIYKISNKLCIPYLKNTTPLWSNRGKFRNAFYKATHDQYGSSVDDKMVYVADVLSDQTKLIHRLLYSPILESYDIESKTFDISRAIEAECDLQCWSFIFEQLCHKKLGISKPSIHALKDFHKRINGFIKSDYTKMKVHLKGDLTITIDKIGDSEYKYIASILV